MYFIAVENLQHRTLKRIIMKTRLVANVPYLLLYNIAYDYNVQDTPHIPTQAWGSSQASGAETHTVPTWSQSGFYNMYPSLDARRFVFLI